MEVKTYNPYTFRPVTLILAKDRFSAYFNKKAEDIALGDYKEGDKLIPYEIVAEYQGPELEGIRYEQLLPWMTPMGDAFRVILGDYVSTEDFRRGRRPGCQDGGHSSHVVDRQRWQ